MFIKKFREFTNLNANAVFLLEKHGDILYFQGGIQKLAQIQITSGKAEFFTMNYRTLSTQHAAISYQQITI